MAHDVFISHSTKDKATADAACSVLESNGIRCWIAPRDVPPGMNWGQSIVGAIKEAQVMVLVFSANANYSPQIAREVERAVNRGLTIIPLRIEEVAPASSLEYYISTAHWLDAFTPPLEKHLQHLSQVILKILGRLPEEESTSSETPVPSATVAPGSPARTTKNVWGWFSVILAVAVLGMAVVWLGFRLRQPAIESPSKTAPVVVETVSNPAVMTSPSVTNPSWISPELPKPGSDGWIVLFDGKHLYGCSPSIADIESGKLGLQNGVLWLDSIRLRFNLNCRDIAIRAILKKVSGANCGFTIRDSASSRYVAWLNGTGSNILIPFGFGKTINGRYKDLARVPNLGIYKDLDFIDMEFRAEGDQLTLNVEGKTVCVARDDSVLNGDVTVGGAQWGIDLFKSIEIQLPANGDKQTPN